MSRRRAGLTPSLFPFLAVLVCTLGTLILLLALVAGEARQAAVKQADQRRSERSSTAASVETPEPKAQTSPSRRLTALAARRLLEQEQFRLQELVAHREKQTADVERRRDQLTHLERQRRRLSEQLQQLQTEVERATSDPPDTEVDQQTLVLMKAEIDQLEKEVAELRESATDGRPRVVLVPHKGPNGTDRRPIYVECTDQGITIWPEEIRLTIDQLIAAAESSRPTGNALDAALRAARAHALQHYGDAAPPYPLLVVRPEGILTYKIAVSAMDDWDDQYGYELVPAEVDLAFPQPDSRLRRRMELAVHEASIRAPHVRAGGGFGGDGGRVTNYPSVGSAGQPRGSRPSLGPLPDRASFEPTDGLRSSDSDREAPFGIGRGTSGPDGAGYAATARGDRQRAAGEQGQRRSLPTLSARDLDLQSQTGGFRPPRDADPYSFSPYGSAVPGSDGGGFGAAPQTVQSQSESLNRWLNATHADAAGPPAFSDSSSASATADASLADRMAGAVSMPDSNETDTAIGSGTGAGESETQPTPLQPNQSQQASDSVQSSAAHRQATNGSASQSQAMAAATGGGYRPQSSINQPPAEMEQMSAPTMAASMSGQPTSSADLPPVRRVGEDWALPASVAGMRGTEVIRPIQLVCHTDRFELIDHGRVVQQFAFDKYGIERATMQLATAIRDRVAEWGATLPGGRWQPRLDVLVAPHADRRFHDLRTFMQNSGVEVTRRLR